MESDQQRGKTATTAQEREREPIRKRKTGYGRKYETKERQALRDRYLSRLVQILRHLRCVLPAGMYHGSTMRAPRPNIDSDRCTGCGWCELHCPDFAISVHEKR